MNRDKDAVDLRVAVTLFRALRSWSQARMARAAGLSASTVSRYETGARVPTQRTFDRMAAAAGIPPALVDQIIALVRLARSAGEPGLSWSLPKAAEVARWELMKALEDMLRIADALRGR